MELVPLDLPGIVTTGTNASSAAARRSYDLWADTLHNGVLPVGYAPLPDEFTISKVLMSLQAPWLCPVGFYGRVAIVADPGGLFTAEMDWLLKSDPLAGQEDGWPLQLKPLATLEVWPGSISGPHVPWVAVRDSLVGPVTLRRGDRLLVVPETNNVDISAVAFGNFAVFAAPMIPMELGCFPLDTGVIHAMPLNRSAPPASMPPGCRTVIPNTACGSQVQVHFSAGADGLSIAHASVGMQSGPGLASMATPPVPLSFNGSPGINLAPGTGAWGAANIAVTGAPIIVDLNCGGGPYGWAYKNRAAPPIVSYLSNTASYGSAAMGAITAAQNGRVHGFDCVKVLP